MQQQTTTVRVSRRTHQLLTELAQQRGRSVSDLLDHLAERARRQGIFQQYNARMAELLANPDERSAWQQETTLSEVSASETDIEGAQTVAR
jgi:hypothetical protein